MFEEAHLIYTELEDGFNNLQVKGHNHYFF